MAKEFDWQKFRYTPSLVAASIFVILFAIMAGIHTRQMVRIKKPFMVWVVVGAAFEVIGYSTRIASHYNAQAWAPFIVSGLFCLIPPLFFAATIYMMLGRTIRLAGGERHCIIDPNKLTKVFVVLDIVTLHVQGAGGAMMGTMKLSLALAGQNVIIAGLALQVFTFLLFILVAGDFHLKILRSSSSSSPKTATNTVSSSISNLRTPMTAQTRSSKVDREKWKAVMKDLYILSALILVRCIFRVVEYAMGNAGYLNVHEVFLYIFDATLMFSALVYISVKTPQKWLPKRNIEIGEGGLEME